MRTRHTEAERLPLSVPLWYHWPCVTPTHYVLRLAADTGANLIVIAGAGHLVHQARPGPFNETAVRFLGLGR